jgi:hypothetical protein
MASLTFSLAIQDRKKRTSYLMWYFAVGKAESDRISATPADKKSALMNLWKDVVVGEKAAYTKACDP